MVKSVFDRAKLADGNDTPYIGLGTYLIRDKELMTNVVGWAFDAGYRHVDTAKAYLNEEVVGKALKASKLNREDYCITTKLWNGDHGYDKTINAFHESLRKLDCAYVDLYLIHWPMQNRALFAESWQAMIKLKEEGKIKTIGCCNVDPYHINFLTEKTGVCPAVVQVEMHPWLSQLELRKYAKEKKITLIAWGSLLEGHLNEMPEAYEIGSQYGKSGAQVLLRWSIQQGIGVIPKSVNQNRIIENADIFDFELSNEDMLRLAKLQTRRLGPAPDENRDTELKEVY